MDMNDSQQDKPDAQQWERNSKIDEIKNKADKVKTDAKIEYYERCILDKSVMLEELCPKHRRLYKRR
jgi:hypothetical protein